KRTPRSAGCADPPPARLRAGPPPAQTPPSPRRTVRARTRVSSPSCTPGPVQYGETTDLRSGCGQYDGPRPAVQIVANAYGRVRPRPAGSRPLRNPRMVRGLHDSTLVSRCGKEGAMRGATLALILFGGLALAVAGRWGIARWLNGNGEARQDAVAAVRNAAGHVLGAITLQQTADGVALRGQLRGLPPGTHGLHFHERGSCTPPDFASAGAHYNPHGRKHGLRNPEGPHAGDLPNLMVDNDGRATVDL